MRRAIWQIEAQVAILILESMDQQVSDSVATDRFQALVLSGFGWAALLLALLGVYGVSKPDFHLRLLIPVPAAISLVAMSSHVPLADAHAGDRLFVRHLLPY